MVNGQALSFRQRYTGRRARRTLLYYVVLAPVLVWLLPVGSLLTKSLLLLAGLPLALVYGTRKVVHKRHLVKNSIRALQKALLPPRLRMGRVTRAWSRKEPAQWPLAARTSVEGINRYEYSLQSQHGEDGIIRYLFDQVGFTNRTFLEFGFGAYQCNALRLILHEDFTGLLIDGSEQECEFFRIAAQRFDVEGVEAKRCFIDRDNLPEIVRAAGLPNDLDFLSIDVDGNDYWFREALGFLQPRVLVQEYNAMLGSELKLTVPYSPTFGANEADRAPGFFGASLAALDGLNQKLGYRLVAVDDSGVNAFWLRNDLAAPGVPTLSVAQAYRPYRSWLERGIPADEQLRIAIRNPYEEIA